MEADQPQRWGEMLRHYRGRAGLTQEQMAERAGLSTRGVQDLESGRSRTPHAATLQLLGMALGLSAQEQAQIEAAARSSSPGRERAGRGAAPVPQVRGLPQPQWPLIGRERERAALATLLTGGAHRLVTLTGVGGVGKTRLAIDLASHVGASFADGTLFVSLAALRDPALVMSAIGQAAGLQEVGGRSQPDIIRSYYREKQALLVLDNVEQVVAAGQDIGTLLNACPRLVVLATGRAALHLLGEQEWPLAPLPLPLLRWHQDLDALATVPSVMLFMLRARAVKPDFALTVASAEPVAAICRRLEGLPLAIELAAARIKALPPQSLLTRLTRRLAVLGGGAIDLPDRHRTLRATLAWSYDLLTPHEQALFRHLTVFAGGCTFESIEAVCTGDDPGGDLLDRLATLVDQNLLGQEEQADGTARFIMLETVREYGLERLAALGEAEALQRRHASHYLALAELAEPELVRFGQVGWARRLGTEHDNQRAALNWALERGELEVALRLGGALWWFWFVRGQAIQGGNWLGRILEDTRQRGEALPAALRAKVYYGAMELAFQRADYGRGGALVAEGFPLCQAAGDRRGEVLCRMGFGFAALASGDFAEAARQFEAGLARAREAQDDWATTVALYSIGWLPLLAGEFDRAAILHEECLALRREVGDTWGVAASLHALGLVAHTRGDLPRAGALFTECLGQYQLLDNELGVVDCVEGLAAVACARGQATAAACLFGATTAWREALGASVWPIARAVYGRATAAAREALGDEGYAREWAIGRGMDLAMAADTALGRGVRG